MPKIKQLKREILGLMKAFTNDQEVIDKIGRSLEAAYDEGWRGGYGEGFESGDDGGYGEGFAEAEGLNKKEGWLRER